MATATAQHSAYVTSTEPPWWKRVWAFLSSLKLLLIILCLGAIPLAIGSLFQQKALGGFDRVATMEKWGVELFTLLDILNIFNIYYSWYFQFLIALLSLNNVCCTIDRFFIKMQRLTSKAVGVIIVHIGVNTVLLGAFIGSKWSIEGFMPVFEGTQESRMIDLVTNEEIEVPFTVQLDDFRLVMWEKPAERLILVDPEDPEEQWVINFDSETDLPKTRAVGATHIPARIWRGLTGGSERAVRIDEFVANATINPIARPSDEADAPWVMDLEAEFPDHGVGRGYVMADAPDRTTLLPGILSVSYVRAASEEAYAQLLDVSASDEHEGPRLLILDKWTGVETAYPIDATSSIELDDGDVMVKVVELQEHYGKADNTGAPNPAVNVEVSDSEDRSQTGWLFARFGAASVIDTEDFTIRFRTGPAVSEETHQIDVVVAPNGQRTLVHRVASKIRETRDVTGQTNYNIAELRMVLRINGFVDGASFDTEITEGEDEHGEGHAHNPAIHLTFLDGGEEAGGEWIFAGQPVTSETGLYRMVYRRDPQTKEFQSDLTILKNGEVYIPSTEIIVNRYLDVDGYHIYQASYDEEGGRWSGLQIKKAPGIPITYSGFFIMFAGIVFLFYVRPVMEARRKGTSVVKTGGEGM